MKNDNSNERAKNIFLENYGNRELMIENNCFEEYRNYSISIEKEIAWKNEFINEQLLKIKAKLISVSELVSSLFGMINSFREVPDYERLLDIYKKYIEQSDLFIQVMYFEKAYEALIMIFESNSNLNYDFKKEIIQKLSYMIENIIKEKGYRPNEIYKGLASRYGLECKDNYLDKRLERILTNLNACSSYLQ